MSDIGTRFRESCVTDECLRVSAKIFTSIIRQAAPYELQWWATTVRHERVFHAIEMRMLVWCLWVTRYDHIMSDGIGRYFLPNIASRQWLEECKKQGFVGLCMWVAAARISGTHNPEAHSPCRRPHGRPNAKQYMEKIGLAPENAKLKETLILRKFGNQWRNDGAASIAVFDYRQTARNKLYCAVSACQPVRGNFHKSKVADSFAIHIVGGSICCISYG